MTEKEFNHDIRVAEMTRAREMLRDATGAVENVTDPDGAPEVETALAAARAAVQSLSHAAGRRKPAMRHAEFVIEGDDVAYMIETLLEGDSASAVVLWLGEAVERAGGQPVLAAALKRTAAELGGIDD